jgi:hypothetical protein
MGSQTQGASLPKAQGEAFGRMKREKGLSYLEDAEGQESISEAA